MPRLLHAAQAAGGVIQCIKSLQRDHGTHNLRIVLCIDYDGTLAESASGGGQGTASGMLNPVYRGV